jgi:hypothetical protein
MVIHMQQPQSYHHGSDNNSKEMEFLRAIRMHLAENNAVIIKGWYSQSQMNFTSTDFQRGYTLSQQIQYQGQVPYHLTFLHLHNQTRCMLKASRSS